MSAIFWIVLALQGCATQSLTDNDGQCNIDEIPLSQVQSPPADEAVVMAMVQPESVLTVAWDIAPLDVPQSDVVVTLARGSAEATVAARGRVGNQACDTGSFLRIPYDLSVQIGADDAIAAGSAIVQSDDQDPPALEILTPGSLVFPGPRLEVALSPAWEAAAEAGIPESWINWTWQLSVYGPLEAPGTTIDARYEMSDADGLKTQWRGQTVP